MWGKKILLPLRKDIGLFLKKEMENEIKAIVRKKGIDLINSGLINEKEFNEFTISFSWIKQLLKEYKI
jgi:hypothetical protein